MNNKIIFSIIMPTYNREDKILIAINSLLAQSYENFEIIIIDDGSIDNTEKIVKSITDERIHYFKKENEERSIARNYGIKRARGKYIGFLDADDYVLKNHLKLAYENLKKLNFPRIIHSGYKVVNENNETLAIQNNLGEDSIKNLVYNNTLHCNAIFIQKDLINEYHFLNSNDATISEDWYLWLILAARFKFHFYNDVTAVVIEHAGRSLNNLNALKVKKSFDLIIDALLKDSRVKKKYGDRLNEMTANKYLFCANVALNKKEPILFLKCLVKASITSPKRVVARLIISIGGRI